MLLPIKTASAKPKEKEHKEVNTHDGRLQSRFSAAQIEDLAEEAKLPKKVPISQFKAGLKVEREHRDILKGNEKNLALVAAAHLKELPDYYTRLRKVEKKASAGGAIAALPGMAFGINAARPGDGIGGAFVGSQLGSLGALAASSLADKLGLRPSDKHPVTGADAAKSLAALALMVGGSAAGGHIGGKAYSAVKGLIVGRDKRKGEKNASLAVQGAEKTAIAPLIAAGARVLGGMALRGAAGWAAGKIKDKLSGNKPPQQEQG
jgi:hypothetical protein